MINIEAKKYKRAAPIKLISNIFLQTIGVNSLNFLVFFSEATLGKRTVPADCETSQIFSAKAADNVYNPTEKGLRRILIKITSMR